MILDTIASFGPGPAAAAAIAVVAAAAIAACALLPTLARRYVGRAGFAGAAWSGLADPGQRGLMRASAATVALAATAFTVAAWTRDAADVSAQPGAHRFALVEREFTYRMNVANHRVALAERSATAALVARQQAYEDQLATLQAAYEYALDNLASNAERLVRLVGEQFGLNPDFFARIVAIESGFNPTIANQLSRARGLFQFMPRTWNTIGEHFADEISSRDLVFEPVTRDNRDGDADPRNRARLSAVMGALLTRYNMEAVETDDPAIIYLAHFAGAEMASTVRDAMADDPERMIRDVLREVMPNLADAVIEQNAAAYPEDATVQWFYEWSAEHFHGIDSAVLDPEAEDAAAQTGAAVN